MKELYSPAEMIFNKQYETYLPEILITRAIR